MKFIFWSIIFFSFFSCGCLPRKVNQHAGILIYRGFDSLDAYIMEQVFKVKADNDSIVAIGVDVKCVDCLDKSRDLYTNRSLFRFKLFTGSEIHALPTYERIMRATGRYFEVGNKRFPLILIGVDDLMISGQKPNAALPTFSKERTVIADKLTNKIYPYPDFERVPK